MQKSRCILALWKSQKTFQVGRLMFLMSSDSTAQQILSWHKYWRHCSEFFQNLIPTTHRSGRLSRHSATQMTTTKNHRCSGCRARSWLGLNALMLMHVSIMHSWCDDKNNGPRKEASSIWCFHETCINFCTSVPHFPPFQFVYITSLHVGHRSSNRD